jgi:hypothetical protein
VDGAEGSTDNLDSLSEQSLDLYGLEVESEASDAVGTISKFFQMLDRLVTVLRVYPKRHPVVENVASGCIQRLSGVLESEGIVNIKLTPHELLYSSDEVVFSREMSESDRFPWYNTHADGVWLLSFEDGVDVDELQRFMRVINKVATESVSSDDDCVTLLWEQRLEHIHYRAVDTFVDNETIEEFDGLTPKEMVDLVVEAAIEPEGESGHELRGMFQQAGIEGLDWFTSQRLANSLKSGANPVGREHLEYALAMEPDKLGELSDEWYSGSDLEFRFVEALLSIIRSSPGEELTAHIQEIIEKMTLQMIERELFDAARRVLELLKSRQDVFEGRDNPLERILEHISEPEVIEGLLWLMQRTPEKGDEVAALLGLLDHDRVEKLTVTMLSGDNELPSARALVDVLFDLELPDGGPYRLESEALEQDVTIERLLPELADRDLHQWPPSIQVVTGALTSGDNGLVLAALELDGDWWSDVQLVNKGLTPLVEHVDETIRRKAYGRMAAYRPRMFQERIGQLVEDGSFGEKSAGELRFLFRTYLEQANDARDALLACIGQSRGWLGDAGRRAAVAAAHVLIARGDQEAIERVRERADSLLTAPKLKQAFKQALKAHEVDSDASEVESDTEQADTADGTDEPPGDAS